MPQRTEIFELGRLGLSSGEGRRLDLEVPVDGFEFGGQRYSVPGGAVQASLDVAHTTTGYSLRLRFEAALIGPCMRCLEEAGRAIDVDAREVDQPGGGEELTLALPRRGAARPARLGARRARAGAAGPDRLPRRLPAGCARSAARTSTWPSPATRTSASPIRAGRRCVS